MSGGDHRSPHTRPHSPSAAAKRLKRNEPEDGNEDLVVDDNGDNNNQAPPMQNGNHHSPLSSNGGGENGKKSPGSPAGSESSSSSKKREDSGKKNLKPPTPTSKPMLPGLQIWFYDNTCKKIYISIKYVPRYLLGMQIRYATSIFVYLLYLFVIQ